MSTGVERRETKQERVYRTVRDRIVRGEYGPGFRIVFDSIAGELGVSALPVREAVRRLEAEGLVIFVPNAGAHVAPVEPGAYFDQLAVLALLEGQATALAAPELTEADIARLDELTDEMVDAMEHLDALRFGSLNNAFHAAIYERCPNAALVDLLRQVTTRLDTIRRTVFLQIPYRGRESIEEHRELIELIERGAPASELELAAREHKLKTLESFRAWYASQAARDDGAPLPLP